ncbi:hypothetical protein H9Y04_21400 [Streptomyces sp. TRM66268-LWL]|uniref:Lipoprotein n=1 Tax=Streptomyces polyasparticus TaxID=2767826 RepID=A0ABR7SHW6_9ACTN|nr:hypothetical protein [Streptomyces polyasparticus]MBC9715111.1 hypothetical protein [Streptomyces polyasparticus]
MKRWTLLVAVPVLLITGCAAGPWSSGPDCTLIGGDSGVTMQFEAANLPRAVQAADGPVQLRLCAGSVCQERTWEKPVADTGLHISVDLDEDIGEVTVPVRFTVAKGSREFYGDQAEVKLRRSQPNGEGCEPTLYQGSVTLDHQRRLVTVTPATR